MNNPKVKYMEKGDDQAHVVDINVGRYSKIF